VIAVLSGTPHVFVGATTFAVDGMTWPGAERVLVEQIRAVEGVVTVAVDLATGTVLVTVDRPVDRADIAAAIEEAGHGLRA
jgi:copper chaperone CopZ